MAGGLMNQEFENRKNAEDLKRQANKVNTNTKNDVTYIKRAIIAFTILIILLFVFGAGGIGLGTLGTQKNKIKTAPQSIYKDLEVEDLFDFVEIKGDDDSGYYLDFIDDADKKLDKAVKNLKRKYDIKTIDKNLLKRMIKAEVVTQYPFLRGSGSSGSSYAGNTVAEKVWNFLISNGYSEIAVAGVMGNIHQESGGFNPDIVENGGSGEGIGLCQWSYGRRTQLENYARAMGKDWSDVDLQLDFLLMEITGNGNGYANAQFMYGQQSVWENAETVEEATIAFEKGFERAGTPMMDNRIHWANIYYEQYHGTFTPSQESDPEVSDLSSLKGVLFIGDSITQGLSQNGGITDEGVQFRGVVSSNPRQWLNNQSVGGVPTYSSLPEDSDDITALCVMLGTNDVSQTSEMKGLLEKLHQKYPNKMIYVQKILPLSSYQAQVNSYNSEIESYCSQNGSYLTFIDSTEGVTLADGIHPTSQGYKTLANNTKNAIQNNGGIINAKGFQGTIRIRRVTPNKNIGQIKNTGKGSSSTTSNTVDSSGVNDYIKNNITSGTWSVYAKNLVTNQEKVNINNRKMRSASLIKLFIMATAYGQISEEKLEKQEVINDIKAMISTSDNDATNRLIDKLGFARINTFIQGFGCTSTEINRKMLESTSHGDNYTSVRDVGKLLEAIYRGSCISKEASQEMLEILKTQTRTNKIPSGLPSGVATANKTGELYEGVKVENDAAIVFKENAAYILVVMSSDISDNNAAIENIKEISRRVYNTISSSGSSDGGSNANAKHKVAIVAGHGSKANSGSYEEIANRTKWYTTGTSGITPSGETWSERNITKKVADYVERFLSGYSDLSVVQVGYSKPNWERMQLAKNQGVDAYIGIHFNSSADTSQKGVSAYYRNGDNKSKEFADIFAKKVSEAMGLDNRGVENDSTTNNGKLDSIGNSSEWGFPSTLIEGGFMSNTSDMAVIGAANEEGLKKYAKGIAEGVLEYYNIENTGVDGLNLNSSTTDTYSAVDSKIYDLRYVSPEKFESYVSQNDRQALNVYTLDEETNKLVVANWSFSTEEKLKITKSNPINYRSVINKYTMPIEYMIAFLVHSDDPELTSNLADLAIDSEFVIAVQDNVTTVQTTVDYQEETYTEVPILEVDGWRYETQNFVDWHTVTTTVTVRETVSNDIELTYADTWFVKFYKTSSYSTISFDEQSGNNLVGDKGDLIGNYKITTYCSACNSPRNSTETASGARARANHTIAVHESDYNGSGPLSKGSKVVINGQVYTVEDTGDTNNVQPSKWIDIFIETENGKCVCNRSSINSNSTEVYKAENVKKVKTEETQSNNQEEDEKDTDTNEEDDDVETIILSEVEMENKNLKGLNTVANVNGKVTETVSITEEKLDTWRVETEWEQNYNVTQRKNITTIRTVSNKYDSGVEEVEDNSQKFIDIFLQSSCKNRFNINWMEEFLQQSEKTVNMIDLTRYLYKKAMEQNQNMQESQQSYNFDVYKVNDLTKIYRSTGILEEYIKSLENNALRLYMNNHVSYTEGYEKQEIEKYVTLDSEEPKYKIFTNDFGGWGYGYNIYHKLNENDWNTGDNNEDRIVEHYEELGVDITSHTNEGMEIEVDVVDQVMRAEIEKWKETVEESLDENGIELEEYQKDALIYIAYKYGWSEEDTISFIGAYQIYYMQGLKTNFREQFKIAQGTITPFKEKEDRDNENIQKENEKIESLWNLFDNGKYRTLEGEILDPDSFNGFGSTEMLGAAEEIWKIVCQSYTSYGALGTVPPSSSQSQTDCSGYVSWVLYQYGVNTKNDALVQEFSGWQHNTESLKSVNWESLGFEVIPVSAGQDVRGILQPGDILDRSTGTGSAGHTNICVDVSENGNVHVYDCGSTRHWTGKNGEPSTNTGFAATDSRAGIIIRKK